ncbi:hypothetical protein Tco_0302684 [Tanacetum coccineum]
MVYQLTMFHVQRVDMVINPPWNLPFLGAKGLTSPEQTATGKGISNPLMAVMVCQKPYGIQLTNVSHCKLLIQDFAASFDSAVHRVHDGSFDAAVVSLVSAACVDAATYFVSAVTQSSFVPADSSSSIPADNVPAEKPMPSVPTQSPFTYPNPNPSASPSFTQDDTFMPEPIQPMPTFTQTAFSQPAFSQPNQSIFSQPTVHFQPTQPTGQQYPNNVQSQQFQQFQTASISANNAKFPYLEKDKYEIWAMKMEYWIQNADHNLWRIVQQGNSPKRLGKDAKGNTIVHPPVSLGEHVAVQRENKVRTLLL